MKARPYKGLERKEAVRGLVVRRHGGIALLKETRQNLNRAVRRQSKAALYRSVVTDGDYDQDDFLIGGEWLS